jgi:hypothetical protein
MIMTWHAIVKWSRIAMSNSVCRLILNEYFNFVPTNGVFPVRMNRSLCPL